MIKYKSLLLLCLTLIILTSLSSVQAQNVNDPFKNSFDNETFSNLEDTISNADDNSIIILDKNYTSTGNEITINKSLTIDGRGYSLNGNNTSQIFYIQSSNVVVKNINFINGKSEDKGGAVFSQQTAMIVILSIVPFQITTLTMKEEQFMEVSQITPNS